MTPGTRTRRPGHAGHGALGSLADVAATDTAVGAIGGVVLALVGAAAVLRVATNLPGALPPWLGATGAALAVVGPTGVAVAVVALAVAHDDERTRAGLAVAGVFGLLGLHVPAATLPAVAALGGGAALVVAGVHASDSSDRVTAVAGVVWLGVVLSTATATGVLDAALRPAASTVALVGVAMLPLAMEPSRAGWLAGGAAAGVILWAGTAAPYVTGAVALVGAGAVGAPLVAVAAGTGGGVAGLGGAATRGRWRLALAAGVLVAAGVPATLPRALAAATALAMLAGGESR